MREPAFWWRAAGIESRLLTPVAAVYGAIAGRRLMQPGQRVRVPVICVGNPTLGGAGKTPTALAVARLLIAAGEKPVLLCRGYGGALAGPVEIDLPRHRASDVGDEALLLARAAPTIVARDRVKGAEMAVAAGAGVIVTDDGFQNPALAKDFSVLVVDARRGLGNGRVFPAGPLRAPLAAQMRRAHALLVVGAPIGELAIEAKARAGGTPVFRARLEPEEKFLSELRGGRVLAFAGIGDPEKFFATLKNAGIAVAVTRSFPDHHRYTRRQAAELCREADRNNLMLVTTEKDAARLQGYEELARLHGRALALPVILVLEDQARFADLLRERIAAARAELIS
jgi:tetraacyldisaccharide 4'-kinase